MIKSASSGSVADLANCGRVLVVDDHAPARESMTDILRHCGHQVEASSNAIAALELLEQQSFDVVVTDLQMPGMTGLEFIHRLEKQQHGAQILMVTAHATVASAVDAMRHGAFDYIEKPFDVDKLEQLVLRALHHGRCMDQAATRPVSSANEMSAIIGSSRCMQILRARILQVAATNETVLIHGESGTGKELVARMLHASSNRASEPLVSLNCPVLSAQLMESELFGHERGAFTGADTQRTGRFELAHRGTILLDEITEIDLGLQAKLLRVLQERAFERVGSSSTVEVDVRVLATTNRNLKDEITAGRFREDLYYRLAVLPLAIPSLRERKEDLPELVDHFLKSAAVRLGKSPCVFAKSAMDLMASYDWPGNVRELENIVTRASVLNLGDAVTADDLRPWLMDERGSMQHGETSSSAGLSLEDMERKLIEETLERFGGHRAQTAQALGIGIRTLSGKLKLYGYAPRTKAFAKAS